MSLLDNMNNGKNQKQTKNRKQETMSSEWQKDIDKNAPDEEFSEQVSYEPENYGKLPGHRQNKQSGKTEESKKKAGQNSFEEEFSDQLAGEGSRLGIQSYSKAGVTFEKLSETQARIEYSGLLAKSGAQDITGVYGFGSNQTWENVSQATLKKESGDVFSAIIPVDQGKNVNVAFQDPAENWDNNSGMNYTFVN
mgnify:CR=1 FL=1